MESEYENRIRKTPCLKVVSVFAVFALVFALPLSISADIFESSSYKVFQPVTNSATVGSSTNFQLSGTITQVAVLPTATSGPTMSNINASLVSYDTAVITWKTDVVASSTVNWGTSTAYGNATSSSAMTIEHALAISGLSNATTYYYKVNSYDALGNASTSDNGGAGHTFTTQTPQTVTVGGTRTIIADYADTAPPLIDMIDITDITSSTALISFKTSKIANAIVKYGTGSTFGSVAGNEEIYSIKHAIPLSGLQANTDYVFRVRVVDTIDTANQSNELSFKTAKTGGPPSPSVSFESAGALEKLSDADKGTIEKFSKVIKVAPLTFVNNAIKAFLSAIADNPVSKEINEESFTAAVSEAASKIIASPQISGTDISVKPESRRATVSWTTDKKADSLVAFVKAQDYKPTDANPYAITVGFPDEQVTKHTVVLDNLDSDTVYHFQLRSQGQLGPIALSGDQTFKTLSLTPEITNVRFTSITEESATVEWETNLPTKNTIEITNSRTGETVKQEDESFLKVHKITLKDFSPSTNYTLRLKAVDEAGSTSFPSVIPFTTALSTTPPKVSGVRIVASLVPDQLDTVQTIISWKTDKPSNSQVFYGEGISKTPAQKTPVDQTFVKDHIVITTALKAGRVYQIKVVSSDAQGHIGESDFYTTLTPRPKQSAIDLILKNLEGTFGFLKL